MFSKQHLITLFPCLVRVVFILMRFSYIAFVRLTFSLCGFCRGVTVQKLQRLCFLVWILVCQCFEGIIIIINNNKSVQIRRKKSCSIQSGMDAVSPDKTRVSQKSFPIIHVAHIVCWTPLRQPSMK